MSMSRSEAASVAANTRWAHEPDRTVAGRRGHAGLVAKFEKQVDPDGVLTPDERARRAKNLLNAHMTRMRAARRTRRTTRT